MHFARVRSSLPETRHEAIAVAMDERGRVLFESGDLERPMYYRSAIKPIQAAVVVASGADLPPEHLAVACASHGGFPVHLAIVDQILADAGLDRTALRCTVDRPLAKEAWELQIRVGRDTPSRRFHNCSGKHASWLAACVANGWDTDTYLESDHPLQSRITDLVRDATGVEPEPVGVDGCGAPVHRGTVIGLARAFSRLTTDPSMEPVATAMTRYGSLVADNTRSDGKVAASWGGPVKVGAEGCIAMARHGVAIATKSLDGADSIAVAAALVVASEIGMMGGGMDEWLDDARHPAVRGGGHVVGRLERVA